MNHPKGIEENDELFMSYPKCSNDLQELKDEGWVRVIFNKKSEKKGVNILYPVNIKS
jgi:hypothetical protein